MLASGGFQGPPTDHTTQTAEGTIRSTKNKHATVAKIPALNTKQTNEKVSISYPIKTTQRVNKVNLLVII